MMAKANLSRTLVVAAVVVAAAVALFGVGPRTAEPQTTTASTTTYYKVQDLGTLGGVSYATGINDSGKVVGWSSTSIAGSTVSRAFLYDESATPKMQDLGDLGDNYDTRANDINNSGKVVGYSYASNGGQLEQHGFLYDSTNGMKDLNDLIPADSGGTISEARAINTDGKIAATVFKPFGTDPAVCQYENYSGGWSYAAVLTPATTATYEVQDLGTLGGDYSAAAGINDSGTVVGSSLTSSCVEDAFLYDSTNGMQDLGTLGGPYSAATGINDSGKVVGYSADTYQSCANNCWRAFLYDGSVATPKMQDLGTLGGHSNAWGINDSGKVVGYSYVWGSGDHGFLKESGQPMIDLNSLIPADSGWTVRDARAINTDGQIAATGYKEGVGQRALLLTPTGDTQPPDDTEVPSPPSITSPQNNTYDSDGSFSVSGSAEAGSTVELFEGTTSKGTTKADSSSGAWSIALSGLSEGAHTYTAKAKDAAGNISSASDSVTVTVDKTAPKVDSVNPKEDATGVAPGVNVTATFSEGMRDASVKSSFKLYKKGTTTALGASVSYGTTSRQATLDPSANLKRGSTYKAVVSVGAQDLAGNPLAQQKVWYFTVG
jgi:probable HAF family extracellular repeat protein